MATDAPATTTRKVWKWELPTDIDCFTLETPQDLWFLTAQVQHGKPVIWADVWPPSQIVTRRFRWVGTGHEPGSETPQVYRGTVQLHDGDLVLHLYEVLA